MRTLEKAEKEKRGCLYCLDRKTVERKILCKHNECPYHELDEFETYEDYFETSDGFLYELFGEEETQYEN